MSRRTFVARGEGEPGPQVMLELFADGRFRLQSAWSSASTEERLELSATWEGTLQESDEGLVLRAETQLQRERSWERETDWEKEVATLYADARELRAAALGEGSFANPLGPEELAGQLAGEPLRASVEPRKRPFKGAGKSPTRGQGPAPVLGVDARPRAAWDTSW